MTKKERMYINIALHGNNIKRVFNIPQETDPVLLCKKLHRLENKAHALAVHYCNGTGGIDSENWEEKITPILSALNRLINFRKQAIPVFVNGDARGYALKIRAEWVSKTGTKIYTDWGGYGIIAPDFSEI